MFLLINPKIPHPKFLKSLLNNLLIHPGEHVQSFSSFLLAFECGVCVFVCVFEGPNPSKKVREVISSHSALSQSKSDSLEPQQRGNDDFEQ